MLERIPECLADKDYQDALTDSEMTPTGLVEANILTRGKRLLAAVLGFRDPGNRRATAAL